MTHYDIVEWKLFKENLLDENIKIDMEDHLLECDKCMDIFLSLVDEELEESPKVSDDFTHSVMGKIQSQTQINKINKRTKKSKKNIYNELLVYYIAVASVAIFLTGTGFFNTIVSQTPEFGETIIVSKKQVKLDSVYNFSKNITNTTSNFVRDFNLEIKEKR